jgi:hypothetical protein
MMQRRSSPLLQLKCPSDLRAHLVVGRANDDADAGEHRRSPAVVAPVDGMIELHDGDHPLERLPEDAPPVGVVAPGRGQLEVPADKERLRPAGHRRRHRPQVDAPGASARPDRRRRRRREQRQQQPRSRRHLRQSFAGSRAAPEAERARAAGTEHRVVSRRAAPLQDPPTRRMICCIYIYIYINKTQLEWKGT